VRLRDQWRWNHEADSQISWRLAWSRCRHRALNNITHLNMCNSLVFVAKVGWVFMWALGPMAKFVDPWEKEFCFFKNKLLIIWLKWSIINTLTCIALFLVVYYELLIKIDRALYDWNLSTYQNIMLGQFCYDLSWDSPPMWVSELVGKEAHTDRYAKMKNRDLSTYWVGPTGATFVQIRKYSKMVFRVFSTNMVQNLKWWLIKSLFWVS